MCLRNKFWTYIFICEDHQDVNIKFSSLSNVNPGEELQEKNYFTAIISK